jgi:chromosome segregation ATPase
MYLGDLIQMGDRHSPLTDDEIQVLRSLQRMEGQRFSIQQLTDAAGLVVQVAERALFSLEKHGLIKIRVIEKEGNETGSRSLENALLKVEELIARLSKLASKKESTKITVYDRVKERLNEDLSRAVANLEFAVDRTHEQLGRLTKEIAEHRDQIDELALMVEIGETSAEEADRKIQECRDEIARLETRRKEVFQTASKARGSGVLMRELGEKESQALRGMLEELEVRQQVGEFDGKEEEFRVMRDQIVTSLASLAEQGQENVLLAWSRNVAQLGRVLVDADVFSEDTSNRLSRASERIHEMSLSAKPEQGK